MRIIRSPESFQSWRKKTKRNLSIGFVPTMGALHEGHLALVQRSLKENPLTVVSIFVNPTQFGPKEDFSRYPRPWKHDRALLQKIGVDVLFSPFADSMYAAGTTTEVSVNNLNDALCGRSDLRGPAHFNGVATVVAKLFNIVQPTKAYFGLKDFQQVRVIEQMTQDLNFGIQIRTCPTIREWDGLALSSRNRYLSPRERLIAPRFYAALQRGRKLLTSKPRMRPQQVSKHVRGILSSLPDTQVEYVELVDPSTLQKLTTFHRPALLAAAIRLGKTRLIDNILIN